MNGSPYRTSFKIGGLFHFESVKLAELYLKQSDWRAVREHVIAENTLQVRTQSSLKRYCSEIISRLKTLGTRELALLAQGDHHEQLALLWIAICRRYHFVADFAVEVLRERYILAKSELHYEDFDIFFNRKAQWHPELDRISSKTRGTMRYIIFKMMREAELLSGNNISPAKFTPRLFEVIQKTSKADIAYFPLHESDAKEV